MTKNIKDEKIFFICLVALIIFYFLKKGKTECLGIFGLIYIVFYVFTKNLLFTLLFSIIGSLLFYYYYCQDKEGLSNCLTITDTEILDKNIEQLKDIINKCKEDKSTIELYIFNNNLTEEQEKKEEEKKENLDKKIERIKIILKQKEKEEKEKK